MSQPNPYWQADTRQRHHRVRVEGRLRSLIGVLVPLGVAAVLTVVVRPVFMGFLDDGPDALAPGLAGLIMRLGLLIVGASALDVYTALIRSDNRAVFDLHPVDAGAVVHFEVLRTARARLWVMAASAVLLLPIAVSVSLAAYALSLAAVCAVWVMSLPASALMHLGAVWMSDNDAMAPLLDALRGSNPRAQAAFLYAPGAILAATSGVVWMASVGAARAATGHWLWAALLLTPLLTGAVAWLPLRSLALGHWSRASAVLADIDARYSVLEQADDGLRVYLDWAVRFVPRALSPYLTKDLRHGWRARRTAITLAWAVGIIAALAGWSASSSAPVTTLSLGVIGIAGLAVNGVLMERDQPYFLTHWLPHRAELALVARVVAVFGWGAVAVWLPLPVLWLRHGLAQALTVCGLLLLCSVVASLASGLCSRRPAMGLWIYSVGMAVVIGLVVTATRLGGVL